LLDDIKGYKNSILVSSVEGRGGQGSISGLNGLLLGVARERELDAVCLMGEIPYYLHGAPWPYPRASRSVLEVFGELLGTKIDLTQLDERIARADKSVEEFLENFFSAETIPLHVRDKLRKEIEELKDVKREGKEPTTEEVTEGIVGYLDQLFKKDGGRDERSH
jgi:hypothetical protein